LRRHPVAGRDHAGCSDQNDGLRVLSFLFLLLFAVISFSFAIF
jgi:hypothetical protein